MKNYKYIGDNVMMFMGDTTPAELSRSTGVPAMTIGRIIRGETKPQIDTLDRIAHGLNTPLCAIVCENEVLRQLIVELSSMPSTELQAVKTILKR